MSCCGNGKNVLKTNELNRKIIIQRVETVINPEGIPIETWTNVVTVWSSRKPLVTGAREYFQAAAINADKRIQYRIRYRKNIFPNMRLIDLVDGKTYNIMAVLDDFFGDRSQTHLITELLEDG